MLGLFSLLPQEEPCEHTPISSSVFSKTPLRLAFYSFGTFNFFCFYFCLLLTLISRTYVWAAQYPDFRSILNTCFDLNIVFTLPTAPPIWEFGTSKGHRGRDQCVSTGGFIRRKRQTQTHSPAHSVICQVIFCTIVAKATRRPTNPFPHTSPSVWYCVISNRKQTEAMFACCVP